MSSDDGLPAGIFRVDDEGPEDGETYAMYHGTTSANARSILASGFCRSSDGMLGPGVYLSRDLEKASRYPMKHPVHDKVVIRVKVNVGRVKAIDRQNHPLQKTWHDHGYDTAWVPPNCGMVRSGLEEDCVWDPKRITVIDIIKPKPVQGAGGPEDGETYAMYHGTTSANARSILASGFCRSSDGMLGPGVYLSRDLDKASRYPMKHPVHDKVVIRVKVNVGRVKAIDRQNHPLQKTWHDHGYDTAWVPPNCGMVRSGLEEDCVWDPKRITVIDIIKPKPVQGAGGSAWGYR
uniref:PARP catalytic domain-containing protein n=1 Tax=Oreochromis niloticus TaxID=8128 RepID=I3JSP2_ORENI